MKSRWSTAGEANAYEIGYIEGMADSPRWTPIENGPPKEYGKYFVTVNRESDGEKRVYTCYYGKFILDDEYDFYDYDSEYGYYKIKNVIAWMPLIKPYKSRE